MCASGAGSGTKEGKSWGPCDDVTGVGCWQLGVGAVDSLCSTPAGAALPFAGLGGLWIRGGQARPPNLAETRDLLAALALLWEI